MQEELIVNGLPKSIISEDIRTVRTNLEFSLSDCKDKIFMVTSSVPSEGKTFISSNLSVALSKNDYKVLLIDCDLRCGRLHSLFNINNKSGLSNLISSYDKKTDIDKYITNTKIKGLSVISRGTVPPNPSELLSSNKFINILEKLKKEYDYVILDSPPVNGLPDALILSKLAEKVVIVSKYGSTNIDALEDTKKALLNVDANIAGVVLNQIPKSNTKYGYYYNSEK